MDSTKFKVSFGEINKLARVQNINEIFGAIEESFLHTPEFDPSNMIVKYADKDFEEEEYIDLDDTFQLEERK